MKILTTVKRVTDPDQKITISEDGTQLETEAGEHVMNQLDEWAVEEAVQQKEEHGGEIVVVSVGPDAATTEMRKAMGMGADRGILVETDEEVDSDGVARLLAKIVEQEDPDLVALGKLSLDTDRNQAGQLLAGYLDWPQATNACDLEIEDGEATVVREVDGGEDTKRFELPGVITAIERLNDPRYASLMEIRRSQSKELDKVTPEELGVDIATKIESRSYERPPEREAGEKVEDVDELVDKLQNEANLI
jgi:electron transfer flavoprotein beta subunit